MTIVKFAICKLAAVSKVIITYRLKVEQALVEVGV